MTVYVVLIESDRDREAWPAVYASRELAEKAFGRVSEIAGVLLTNTKEPQP